MDSRSPRTLYLVWAALSISAWCAFSQDLKLQWINVDSSGNILQLGYDNTVPGLELLAGTDSAPTIYLGGVFSTVKTTYVDGSGNPIVYLYVNGQGTGWIYAYGLNPPNGLSANNVVKLYYNDSNYTLTCYALSTGFYGGSGNGCNGRVRAVDLSSTGDLYVGGDFTQAGGFPYSTKIGVYRASGGWNTSYIFSAWDDVNFLSYDAQNYVLRVGGANLYRAQFYNTGVDITDDVALFHTYFGAFNGNCYWTD